jgi:hypothetical protein
VVKNWKAAKDAKIAKGVVEGRVVSILF